MEDLGKKIRLARLTMGISQGELAKKVGIHSSSYISMIERGARNPSLKVFERISDVLGIQAQERRNRGDDPVSSMTIHEHYAGLAMQGILTGPSLDMSSEECAEVSVLFADALIEELELSRD